MVTHNTNCKKKKKKKMGFRLRVRIIAVSQVRLVHVKVGDLLEYSRAWFGELRSEIIDCIIMTKVKG